MKDGFDHCGKIYKRHFIYAGEIYIAKEPMEIATVLGSCVGVCLFDRAKKISGLNHYLLPLWNGNGLRSPKFGNVSIPKMIEQMEAEDCKTVDMEAKVFGGSNANGTKLEEMLIGKKNIVIAKEILAQHHIPIAAEDTGGSRGRRIVMRSDSNQVWLRYTGAKD